MARRTHIVDSRIHYLHTCFSHITDLIIVAFEWRRHCTASPTEVSGLTLPCWCCQPCATTIISSCAESALVERLQTQLIAVSALWTRMLSSESRVLRTIVAFRTWEGRGSSLQTIATRGTALAFRPTLLALVRPRIATDGSRTSKWTVCS